MKDSARMASLSPSFPYMNMDGFMIVGIEEKDQSEVFIDLRHGCEDFMVVAKLQKLAGESSIGKDAFQTRREEI